MPFQMKLALQRDSYVLKEDRLIRLLVLESAIVCSYHVMTKAKLISWRNKLPTFHIGTEPFAFVSLRCIYD